jgi:hypothetical protein
VLHTRVSEQLSEDIRRFAEDLRVPASNLVRNVLEEVFTVVDGVSEDVGDLFEDLFEEAEGVRERVRRQTGARPRRRSRRASRAVDVDAEVEDELRRDESADTSRGRAADEQGKQKVASADSKDPSADAGQSPGEARADANVLFPDVLGWQPLVLNRDFTCGRCQRDLRAGESAFLGLAASGLTDIALCGRCAGRR